MGQIGEYLKRSKARIVDYDRWMLWDGNASEWFVYEKRLYAKKTSTLYHGVSLLSAIAAMEHEHA